MKSEPQNVEEWIEGSILYSELKNLLKRDSNPRTYKHRSCVLTIQPKFLDSFIEPQIRDQFAIEVKLNIYMIRLTQKHSSFP